MTRVAGPANTLRRSEALPERSTRPAPGPERRPAPVAAAAEAPSPARPRVNQGSTPAALGLARFGANYNAFRLHERFEAQQRAALDAAPWNQNAAPTHYQRPTGPAPGASAPPPSDPAPSDPAGREQLIRDQLARTDDLDALVTSIPDDPLSFDLLTNILRDEYNVDLVYAPDAERFAHFSTRDLLQTARDLRRLPDAVVQAYRDEGVRIRISNGGLDADPAFRETVGDIASADGRRAGDLAGTLYYHDPEGRSTIFISLEGMQNPSFNLRGDALDGPGGTASVLLHELAHGLDNIGGRDDLFYDISSDPGFRALIDDPEVWAYWERINIDGSYHEQHPEGRYIEAFAELFARYHASDESRAHLPPAVQDYFAGLSLTVT